jgi:radical SAM enzyme (TIGR01210 family)
MPESYPLTFRERTRWILDRRQGIARDADLSPQRVSHSLRETEPDGLGGFASILTLFLTNRECPWRCLMCDLWRHTLGHPIRPGDVLRQIDDALAADSASSPVRPDWLKLYNAGSFFDSGAIPREDLDGIARRASSFRRLVVECHPTLVGPRILPFRDALGCETRLEVAMGLETAHPEVLERLNKGFGLPEFARACDFLKREGVDIRVFVLLRPPFMDEETGLDWAIRSTRHAFDCGADVVTLIPTRDGNGAMEALRASGDYAPPRISSLEAALRAGLGLRRGRVFADTWDLHRFCADAGEAAESKARLERWNRLQDPDPGEPGH